MFKNVFLKALRDYRRSLLFWGIGLVLLALVMTLYYPAIQSVKSISEYMDQLPKGFIEMFTGGGALDITSPVGFFNTELFSLMVPLLFIVFGIGLASSAIAGEEEKGTLDFMLSLPVARRRFLLQKIGLLVAGLFVLGFAFWAGLAIGVAAMHIDLSLIKAVEATISALLLTLVFSSLALLLGCWRGSKGIATGVAGGLAAVTYFLNALGSLVDGLKPFRVISPFYHYIAPNTLANGFTLDHTLVLLGLVIVFLVVSFPLFERRDIAV